MKKEDLKKKKKADLLKLAKKLGVKCSSKMNKDTLIETLLKNEKTEKTEKVEPKKAPEKTPEKKKELKLTKMTKAELLKLAKEKDIKVTSKMTKAKIIKLLEAASVVDEAVSPAQGI